MRFRNPLLEEGLGALFFDGVATRTHLVAAALIVLVTLLAWPPADSAQLVRATREPAVYNIVLFASVLAVIFLTLSFAVENIRPQGQLSLEEWLRLSPIGPLRILWGRLAASAVHSVFLSLLPLPMMLVAAGVTGVDFAVVVRTALLILAMTIAYRTYGLFLLSFLQAGWFVRNGLLWIPVVVLLLVPSLAPAVNPVTALLALQGRRLSLDAVAGSWSDSALFHLALAGLFSALTALRFRLLTGRLRS